MHSWHRPSSLSGSPSFPTQLQIAIVATMEPLDRADLIYHETQEGALCGATLRWMCFAVLSTKTVFVI